MRAEWRESATITISECDGRERMRPSAVQVRMQEVGERHAASLGLSRAYLVSNGVFWVMYRQRVVMDAYPTHGEEVAFITWPGGVEGPTFLRHFLFERPDGAPVGAAVTTWVLLDLKTRRPLRPSSLPGKVPENAARAASLPPPGALRAEKPRLLGRRVVSYSDVDVNGHMNNARYIDWVCDSLDYHALINRGLREWQVNFTAENRPGEAIDLFAAEDGDGIVVLGKKTDGRSAFDARIALR